MIFRAALLLAILTRITTAAMAEDYLKVGWIGPLTGSASSLGVDSVPAIQLVFDDINSRGGIENKKIKLIVEDDQYLTSKTVTAYQKLVKQEKVEILIVITYGGLFAIAEQAERDNVILIDPLDCDDPIAALPSNTFCIAKKTEELGIINAESAIASNDTPTAILYFVGDPFMGTVAESTIKRFAELKAPSPLVGSFQGGTTDFKAQLLRFRNHGAKSYFFYGYDEVGLAMKQARELGISEQFYSLNTISSPTCRDTAGPAIENTKVSSWIAPEGDKLRSFLSAFKAKVGREPILQISTIPSFDVARLIVTALKQRERHEPIHDAVKRYLYSVRDFPGVSGNITIDSDGIVRTLRSRTYRFSNQALAPIDH